jgi:hypothetical protein
MVMVSSAQKTSWRRGSETVKLSLHGPAVELTCDVPTIRSRVAQVLGRFQVDELPETLGLIRGSVRPYNEAEVIRRLPLMAQPLHRPGELTEIYAHEERFWTIDDRWGMCEINLLRGQWQSWVLAQAKMDSMRLLDAAVLWPMSQLLKHRGLHLIPAASVVRGGMGIVLLSAVGLGPELAMLMAGGFRLVGQRWTILREQQENIELLHVPGAVERLAAAPFGQVDCEWEDLSTHRADSEQRQAMCSAGMIVEAARRPRAHLDLLEAEDAAESLRRVWPIPELHLHRRHAHFAVQVSQLCPCFRLQLSREPRDILMLLNSLQTAAAG